MERSAPRAASATERVRAHVGRWIAREVDGSRMWCFLEEPREPSGAGVLVCMHGPGIDTFIEDICGRLTLAGFAALAPDFYHRQPPPLEEAWLKVKDPEAL